MKYHVVVFGCQMNQSDAERVSAVLESAGYKPEPKMEKADLIAVVMCSVRQSAVDRVHFLAHKFSAKGGSASGGKKPITILTGCILAKDKKYFMEGFDYVVDIRDIKKIPKILSASSSLRGAKRRGNPESVHEPLDSRFRENDKKKSVAYVPIMTGCNNFCSYCVVPYTRGREVCRPAKEIISEVKKLTKLGKREIWLLGQNVNSYYSNIPRLPAGEAGNSGIVNFPKLLKLVNDIPGNFKLNFTSSHPKDFSNELIKTMAKCEKLSMDLNLPLQSGDDEILKKMNRPYTVAQYKNLVKKIRKALPNIRLSTDIIVGFPGETKKQFNNTVQVLKEIKYGVAFINKYSPRAGTAAAKMKDDVPWEEKKRREKILIDLVNPVKRGK